MQICLEYIDSAFLPTVGIQNPGAVGAYSRILETQMIPDVWRKKVTSSRFIKHVPSCSHGIHVFQRGNYPQKMRKSPQKVRTFPQKDANRDFFTFGNQGSTNFYRLMADLQPNLPCLDQGVQETKKCAMFAEAFVKLSDQVTPLWFCKHAGLNSAYFIAVRSPVQYDLGHCVTQCCEHCAWGKDCQNALGDGRGLWIVHFFPE